MMRVLIFAAIMMTFSFCGGCATIVRGDQQKLKFQTDPPGATVTVNGKGYQSPVEVTLKRKEPYVITIWAPGYQAIVFDLSADWDGASLGNILMPGGSVGFGVDTLNGADRSFRDLATIKLEKLTGSSTQPVTMYQYRGRVLTKSEFDKAHQELEAYHSRIGD